MDRETGVSRLTATCIYASSCDHVAAMQMFDGNAYKLRFIQKIPEAEPLTVYRMGDFVDLCRGPHLPSTKAIRAISLTKVKA